MRDRLVSAALAVLRRDGAAALTVRNITTEAGCSTTGIYTYFGGKNGLVEAIFLEGFASFDAAVAEPLGTGDVAEAGRRYRQWALDHPTHYLVMFGRAVPDYEPSELALARAYESFGHLVEAARQVSPVDAERRAYHAFATMHGFVMLEMTNLCPLPVDDAVAVFDAAVTAFG